MSGRKVVYKKTYAKGEGTRTTTRREPAARQMPKESTRKSTGGATVLIMPREFESGVDEQPSVAGRATQAGHKRAATPKHVVPKSATAAPHSPKTNAIKASDSPKKNSAGKKPAATRKSGTAAQSKVANGTMTDEPTSKRTAPVGTAEHAKATDSATTKRRSIPPSDDAMGTSAPDMTLPKASVSSLNAEKLRQPHRPAEPKTGGLEQPAEYGAEKPASQAPQKPRHAKRLEPPQAGDQAQPRRAPHASRPVSPSRLQEEPRDRTTIVLPTLSSEPDRATIVLPAFSVEPERTTIVLPALSEEPRDRTTVVLPTISEESAPATVVLPIVWEPELDAGADVEDKAATREMEAIEPLAAIEYQPTIELRAASRPHTTPLTPPSRRKPTSPLSISLPPLMDVSSLDTAYLDVQPQPVVEQAVIVPPSPLEGLVLPDLRMPGARRAPRSRPYVSGRALSRPSSGVRRVVSAAWARRASEGMTRRRKIALAAVALLVLITTAAGIPLAIRYISLYHRDTALASTAMAHLKSAETALGSLSSNPLDSVKIVQAQSQLTAAHANFVQIQSDLNSIPGLLSAVPGVSNKLAGAQKLVPLAVEATQGGIIALNALALVGERLKDPFGAKSTGLTTSDWATLTADFNQIDGLFTTAVQQISGLQPSDLTLDARLAPAVQTFRKDLPNIEKGLSVAQTVIALGPQLLGIGTPVNYLVEVLDSTELRPGGGFVGNYGFLTLSQGQLGDVKMRDVDLLDRSPANLAKTIPVPAGYSWFNAASSWGLRDSNLEANYPTSAQFGEQLLKELGDNTSVQGVITITPWLIQNAMKITGPVTVPQFGETVTADNLVNMIHKYQLGAGHGSDLIYDPDSGSSQRKAFSADLFAQFIALVKKDLPTHMSQFMRLFTSSFQTKDIQVYLNNSKAEALLSQYNLASTIASPAGDGLMVVDANLTGNKANYFFNYTMNDSVTIDAQGNATHHTTLTYAWPVSAYATANEYGGSAAFIYDDYVRVYAPTGSTLIDQSGWSAADTSTAYNRAVFAGHLYMNYGQTVVITLDWKVPHAATHDSDGWHYTTLLERQAGDTWKFTEQVTLPKGCAISGTPALLAKHGASSASLTEYLTTDVSLKLNYGGCS